MTSPIYSILDYDDVCVIIGEYLNEPKRGDGFAPHGSLFCLDRIHSLLLTNLRATSKKIKESFAMVPASQTLRIVPKFNALPEPSRLINTICDRQTGQLRADWSVKKMKSVCHVKVTCKNFDGGEIIC